MFTVSGNAFSQAPDTLKTLSGGTLREVIILTPYERWKRDSAETRIIYGRRMADAVFKPEKSSFFKKGVYHGNLLQVDGFFYNLALKWSGKKKRYQRLKRDIESREREKMEAFRYHPELIQKLTGLNDSASIAFIRENPIPDNLLYGAYELERLQWIRDRYRAWKH